MIQFIDDVESDMSVYHRVDDIMSMPSGRFFKLAKRLPSYQGALYHSIIRTQNENDPEAKPKGKVHSFADIRKRVGSNGTKAGSSKSGNR